MKKIIFLTSAGIDSLSSTYLLNEQKKDYIPVFINYNGIYSGIEEKTVLRRYYAEKILKNHPKVFNINIKSLIEEKNDSTSEFLFRNYIFILLILAKFIDNQTDCIELILNYSKDDFAPDTHFKMQQSGFQNFLSNMVYDFTNKKVDIELTSPIQDLSKPQVWDIAKNNLAFEDFVDFTFSCYNPKTNYFYNEYDTCKKCKACFRFSVALYYMYGVITPHYNNNNLILTRNYTEDYISAVEKYKKALSSFYISP